MKIKKYIASLLIGILFCTSISNLLTVNAETNVDYTSEQYYMEDGTFVDKVSFVENGEYAAVIKRTYTDGTFDVEAINGDTSVMFERKTVADAYNMPVRSFVSQDVTYPHYTDYWAAGYYDYTKNEGPITVAVLAGLIANHLGVDASLSITIAQGVYSVLGGDLSNKVYFRTYKYYATLDNGPGLPTIWYSKFVTYTYVDADRTMQVGSPSTTIYEGAFPM